jgi:hypothetical protein
MLLTNRAVEEERTRWLARLYACEGRFADFCRVAGYVPHDAQLDVHLCDYRRRVVDWGRRTGKTRLAGMEAAYMLLQDDRRVWVVCPTHGLTERVWSVVTRVLCEDLGFRPSSRRDSPPRRLAFEWGSVCEGHSTEHAARAAMVGAAVDLLIWDECAKSPGSLWETRLQPNLGDRKGRALFISTPEGYNHFHEWFQRGAQDLSGKTRDPDWRSFHAWCEVNFGNVPDLEAVVAEARRTFSEEAFRQEWLGEFTTFAGRVYPEFDEGLHCDRDLQYNPDLPLTLAFDFGVENPFVCLWIQWTPGDEMRVIDEYTTAVIRDGREEVLQSLTTQENGEEVLRQHEDRGYGDWEWAVADRSGADEIRTLQRHCGIRAIYRHITPDNRREREVPAGIRRLRRFIREGRFRINPDRCPITTFELNRYRYPDRPEDRNAQEVPEKANDHAMDCLRYSVAYYLARNPNADRFEERDDEPVAEDGVMRLPTPQRHKLPAFAPAEDRLAERIGRRHRR